MFVEACACTTFRSPDVTYAGETEDETHIAHTDEPTLVLGLGEYIILQRINQIVQLFTCVACCCSVFLVLLISSSTLHEFLEISLSRLSRLSLYSLGSLDMGSSQRLRARRLS